MELCRQNMVSDKRLTNIEAAHDPQSQSKTVAQTSNTCDMPSEVRSLTTVNLSAITHKRSFLGTGRSVVREGHHNEWGGKGAGK